MFGNDDSNPALKMRFCNCTEIDCSCGETNIHEWQWEGSELSNVKLSNNNLQVKFNPGYSSGTAAVRGNQLLEGGKHYFWEIKMVTVPYGTDVMIGIGTDKLDLSCSKASFCSLLGNSSESLGISFKGYAQSGNKQHNYMSHFGHGSLIGIHLDTWRGVLRYFINRKPLDMMFTGLRGIDLYPVACSTAANSIMRLTYSYSTEASLQMECLAVLSPVQRSYLSSKFAGLRYLSEGIFADMLQKQIVVVDDDNDDDNDIDDLSPSKHTILDEFDFALVGLKRRKRRHIVKRKCVTIVRK